MKEKIVVAMSGGVDSSVAAALLKEQGYDVVGISLRLWDYSSDTDDRFGTCCSLDDLADARRVADRLRIPFYILNMEKEFRADVVDYFVAEYKSARTPIPCILCNQRLKFDRLMEKAGALGYNRVATGHFASVVTDGQGRLTVRRGRDRSKDQSYFLFGLSRDQIARVVFPLGDLQKTEVRKLARSLGLRVAEKEESQEICFIPNNDYREFLANRANGDRTGLVPGAIVDKSGKTLGTHDGYAAYTIGQRKGLNLGGLSEPYFVTRIDPDTNTVTVGPKRDLLNREFAAFGVSWYLEPSGPFTAEAQIRYRHPGAPALVTPLPGGRVRVEFDEPQTAVTPGQAAVFYRDDCIVGGGWIE
ncbi:MAG: tRNA 2-thiouridine(34) synthase MnmA [Nitrospinae bacterium]|nr:tRNA 2-thiouridine(34) synthase MnmA [Nitrospinota bacterium]